MLARSCFTQNRSRIADRPLVTEYRLHMGRRQCPDSGERAKGDQMLSSRHRNADGDGRGLLGQGGTFRLANEAVVCLRKQHPTIFRMVRADTRADEVGASAVQGTFMLPAVNRSALTER